MSLAKKISIGALCLGGIIELSCLGLICSNKIENELFKRYYTNKLTESDYKGIEYQKIIKNEKYGTYGLMSYLVTVGSLIYAGTLSFVLKDDKKSIN